MIQIAEQITEVVKDIHVRLILWSAFSRVFLFGKVMTYSGFHLADRQGALRLFQNLLPLLYATHDLHSDGVTQTELYLFLFAFARLASGSLHIGHTVPQGYHPFRKRYNAAGPLDNDVRRSEERRVGKRWRSCVM